MSRFAIRNITRREIIQFLIYLIGGNAYFWSGYLVFAVCYSGLGWRWWPAKMLADVVGWTLNYVVQRYWAFNSKGLKHHEGRTIGKYSLLTVFNLGLDYLLFAGLNAIGISPYISFFISAAFFTAWNYLWYRFWIFFVQGKHKLKEEVV